MAKNIRPTINSHRLLLEKEILSQDVKAESTDDSVSDDPGIVVLPADYVPNGEPYSAGFIISPNNPDNHDASLLSGDLLAQSDQEPLSSSHQRRQVEGHYFKFICLVRQVISTSGNKAKNILFRKPPKMNSLDDCSQLFKMQIREIIRAELKKELYGDESSICSGGGGGIVDGGLVPPQDHNNIGNEYKCDYKQKARPASLAVRSDDVPLDQILSFLGEELKQ